METTFQRAWDLIVYPTYEFSTILETSLYMAGLSSLISFLIGFPIGLIISYCRFPGKKITVTLMRTLMGLPPVGVGIILYVLLSGSGPLGHLHLLYSVKAMIIAQVILITPIVIGMTHNASTNITNKIKPTLKGLKLNPFKKLLITINETKFQLLAVYLFGFARAISEVGAIQIVGGNILHKTRTMTTAIALDYNTGDFILAIALGIIIIAISLIVNMVASLFQWGLGRKTDDRD